MKIYPFRTGLILLIATFSLVIMPGCDSTNPEATPPEVIPSEVFTLPVNMFDPSASAKEGAAKINFTAAALRVWPVSLIVSANLVIPSLATAAALQAEPVYEDGNWHWISTVNVNGQIVQFDLTGDHNNGGTDWSMKITMTDPFTSDDIVDFELFTARTTNEGKEGSWQLYYYVNESSQHVLNGEYTIVSETEKSIVFTIPETAAQNAGDSVRYEENGDERLFIWQQVAQELTHTVTWNAATHEGSILATNYNNGEIACWDSTFEDAVCSE